jgi:hypothetical protein
MLSFSPLSCFICLEIIYKLFLQIFLCVYNACGNWSGSKVTLRVTVNQSVCLDVELTLRLVTRYYFLPEGCCLKVAVLFLLGAAIGPSYKTP